MLALTDREDAQRVRIQWNCDGLNLLIDIHDDGDGQLDVHDDSLRPIAERVKALDGRLDIESTSGWGSHTSIRLPLDPPGGRNEREPAVGLTSRERDVLHLVAAGHRNADIAAELAISPNTVKFHIANLLRKVGARTRSELIALTR